MLRWIDKFLQPARKAATFQSPELDMVEAAWNAAIGSDTAYYPRVPDGAGAAVETAKKQIKDKVFDQAARDALMAALDPKLVASARGLALDKVPEETLDSEAIMFVIGQQLAAIDLTNQTTDTLEALRDRYRESLNEAKEQTEYQDQKAARLLTVVSIFAAIGGVIFGKFIDYYPPKVDYGPAETLVVTSFLAFGLFLLLALTGAMVIFHASRTRYRWEAKPAMAGAIVKSRLFYMPISKTRADVWADAVQKYLPPAPGKVPAVRIEADYLRDSVMESYLIACKANDKVRYLRPAQNFLSLSTKFFLGFLVLAAVTLALVPRWKEPTAAAPSTSIQVSSQSSATITAPADSAKSPTPAKPQATTQ